MPRFEALFFCLYAFLQLGLSVFNEIALLLYIPTYRVHLTIIAHSSLFICTLSTFVKIYVAYHADGSKGSGGFRNTFLLISAASMSLSMLCLASCPFGVGSLFVTPWFLFFLANLFISQNILFKMLHLFLWEISESQHQYSKFHLFLEPIGSAIGACTGLVLSRVWKDFLLVAVASSLGTLTFIVLILNELLVTTSTATIQSHSNEQIKRSDSSEENGSTEHCALLPSIRLVVYTKEFKKVLKNTVLLDVSHIFLITGYTYMLLFGFDRVRTFADFTKTLIVVRVIMYATSTIAVIVCRNIILFKEKLDLYREFSLVSACLAIVMFTLSFSDRTFVWYILCTIVICGTTFVQTSLKYLLVRDLAVLDTFYTGMRRESIYQLAVKLPEEIIDALCGALPQLLLPLTGWAQHFDDNAIDSDSIAANYSWTPATVWLLRIFSTVLVATLSLTSYHSFRDYKLSQAMVDDMCRSNRASPRVGRSIEGEYDAAFVLVMHLSPSEQLGLAHSMQTIDVTARRIYFQNRISFGLACLACAFLVLSITLQYVMRKETLVTLSLMALLVLSMFCIYEYLRIQALESICALPNHDVFNAAWKAIRVSVMPPNYAKTSRVGYLPLYSSRSKRLHEENNLTEFCDKKHEDYLAQFNFTVLILLSIVTYGLVNILGALSVEAML